MARMHPRQLDEAHVKSDAEVDVFRALERDLDDDWLVFHDVSFLRKDPAAGVKPDEIDFVLVHPDRAIICLEVKGGGIECRGGEFRRISKGKRERMPNPFTTALDHRFEFARWLDDHKPPVRTKDIFFVHALATPDISVHSWQLAPDGPEEVVIDQIEMRAGMDSAIEKVLSYHAGAGSGSGDTRKPPGAEMAQFIRDLLAPEIVREITLANAINKDEDRIVELTEQQMAVLNTSARVPRLDVTGMAGSGKTLLAIEHAKRRAALGRDVLYVCFNRALADELNERIEEDGLRIANFHKLCVDESLASGVTPTWYGKANAPAEYFAEELPDLLVDAAAAKDGLFDDIVIDEAQDLGDHYVTALLATLRNEGTAHVWIFRDDNQRVFDQELNVPEGFQPADLNVNCRNTQTIHAEIAGMYEGVLAPECIGPEGRPVEWVAPDGEGAAVGQVIARLLGPDEVPPHDIVVLSAHGWRSSDVVKAQSDELVLWSRSWGFPNPDEDDPRPRVRFESIKAYKGLEAPVVVLCELEAIDDEADREREFYVGASRARSHLVVVGGGRA
jgi:Nuclease-related domain/AAA domain/UvrD-like helicase C-terminal domain